MARPINNPPNPWSSTHVEWLEEPPAATLSIFEEEARSILSENDSPDIPFRFSVNPYRGCLHACAYCYARPSHQYLGFGAGTDFDRKIVVKMNAPELLRKEMGRRSWAGETIVFSGNTDCYQPLEASYELTRRCLQVCLDHKNPVGIITKGALVRRDVALLAELAKHARLHVNLSIAFASDELARKVEPYANRPSNRFEAMRRLADAGVSTGIMVAPIIPGLNDADIPELLARAREAGARCASMTLLRLPAEVLPVFEERIAEHFPDRARKIRNGILEMKGGQMNKARFGERFEGAGARWEAIRALFRLHCQKHGLRGEEMPSETEPPTTFQRPEKQRRLFEL